MQDRDMKEANSHGKLVVIEEAIFGFQLKEQARRVTKMKEASRFQSTLSLRWGQTRSF